MHFFIKSFFTRLVAGLSSGSVSVNKINMRFTRICRAFFFAIIGFALLLAACSPSNTIPDAIEPPSPTPEPSATPTIQWFPPTATPTLLPTRAITPTPVMNTGIGEILYDDLLAESTDWEIGLSNIGTTAYGNGELTLAVSEPTSILTSLRTSPILDDFYLEVTAKPNLCREEDSYGLLVRSNTRFNTYRFAVACNGSVRVERLKNGEVVALQNWTRSGQLPFGAPLAVRLGVLASGDELRFFINDVYQFSTTDPVWRSGQVGLFARSNGETAVSVSFSNMEVRQYDFENATSAIPTVNPFSEEEMDH